MTFKAIFSLFLLVTALATIYAKPSPIWINLDKASEDTTGDMSIIESDKEVANYQTGEMPLSEQELELVLISNKPKCPWPPALPRRRNAW